MKTTTRALIVHQDKILLVQHYGSDFWSLPGGKVEEGEDLKTCLVRELKEELNADAKIGKLRFINEFKYDKKSSPTVEFFFEITNPKAFEILIIGSHTKKELAKIEWRKIEEKMNLKPEFLESKLKGIVEKTAVEIPYFGV